MLHRGFWLPVFSALVMACTPAGAPPQRDGAAPGQPISGPKALTIGLSDQPLNMATLFAGGAGISAGSSSAGDLFHMVHQRLAVNDHLGQSHPELATELPSQEKGSWVVRPDGTMQTTYRIHPGVTWHDGAVLTTSDLVLAWRMTLDPELPISQQSVARQIARLETPDDTTLVIDWARIYVFANAIIEDDLGPFPSHILGPLYEREKQAVAVSPYWTREFIGVGPYRLAEWEPGSHLVLKAYDRFFRGRPKIDTLTFRIIDNEATALANMLAGTIDGGVQDLLGFRGSLTLRDEWTREGHPPVFIQQNTHWRRLGVQFRVPDPLEITDARVRRALYHGVDRPGMVDALYDGLATVADSFIAPDDVKWDWVKDVVARYPYDPRRSIELLAEVGWRKGPDGAIVNAAGEGVTIGVWTTGGQASEGTIVADNWKSLGVNTDLLVLSPAQSQDSRFRVSYPSFALAQYPISYEFNVINLRAANCPSEQTQFRGNNRGCFRDADNERLIEAISLAIDPAQQRPLYRDLARLHSEALPELPLYFNVAVTVFRQGVVGVMGSGRPRGGLGWNVMDWDVVS